MNCATMLILVYIVTLLSVNLNEGAKILVVIPTPSISHQVVFRPITQELARRGHEVTVITTDPVFSKGGTLPNLTEIDVHDLSYKIWNKSVMKISGGQQDFITQMSYIIHLFTDLNAKFLEEDVVLNLINDKNANFDLLLIEAIAKPALVFSHFFKAPVIQMSSFGAFFDNYDTIGVPTHPILYPAIVRRRINNLSVWDKIRESYQHFLLNRLVLKHEEIENAMLRKYLGDKAPDIKDLTNNVDMLFLNIHPLFHGIRPVPPNVVFMGGMHQKPEKELPTYLKSYLDSSKNGVIYLSFGTNVIPSMLPPEKIQTIVKVFSELPYNVLWKYDKDDLPGKSENIRIGKWFPQSDLLRHPNIKLFISQGGLQSTDEAITAGVPLIGIPMLGDQWFNTEKYEQHKIGIQLNIKTLNHEDLKNAINTVISDKSYRSNIVNLRELMLDEPMKPLERTMWWIEYVLRHKGAKHLRSPAANISWAQYLELEIVILLLTAFLVCFALIAVVINVICKSISKSFALENCKKKV